MWARLLELNWPQIVVALIDLTIVTVVLYRLLALFTGTRAMAVINGVVTIIIASLVARYLGLKTLYWLLQKAITAVLVGLPIVFQPELRRGLERIGMHDALSRWLPWLKAPRETPSAAGNVAEAAGLLSHQRIGALFVLRGQMSLSDIVENGIALEARVSTELLCQIFVPNSPLHDGAAIISGDRVLSAACVLPLSANPDIDKELGTRHRAAIGLSELTDATVVIVSEETGDISVALGGRLRRMKDSAELAAVLGSDQAARPIPPPWQKWFKQSGGGRA